jgi:hypothetical protein
LTLRAPRVIVSIAARARESDAWTALVECEFSLEQQMHVLISPSSFADRTVKLVWGGDPQLTADSRFARGYAPENPAIDVEKIRTRFLEAWHAWTAGGPVSEVAVADVDFGHSRLRLDEIAWSKPHLMISYAEPGLKITNRTRQPLVYETRSPFSRWGGPYSLAPGQTHEFKVASPIEYRQHTGRSRTFTLPVGSLCEFRNSPRGGEPMLYRIRQWKNTERAQR